MRVILRFEFDSRAVAIDGADIYDGPDPGDDSSETESERSEAKLHDSFALVAGVKIMSAEKTKQRAENDKGAAVFWVGVRLKIEVERWRRRGCGSGHRRGVKKHAANADTRHGARHLGRSGDSARRQRRREGFHRLRRSVGIPARRHESDSGKHLRQIADCGAWSGAGEGSGDVATGDADLLLVGGGGAAGGHRAANIFRVAIGGGRGAPDRAEELLA